MTAWRTRTAPIIYAALAVIVSACGARTEILDPNTIGMSSNQPSAASGGSGAAAGGAPTAGSPAAVSNGGAPAAGSPAQGGATSAGAGDSVGVGGGPFGSSSSPQSLCSSYCDAIATGACASARADCLTPCTTELSAAPLCQGPAKTVIACLAPILASEFRDCTTAQKTGQATCAAPIAAYSDCIGSVGGPELVTNPPPPAPSSRLCSLGASGDSRSCSVNQKCNDGSYYSVDCMQAGPEESLCTCSSNHGRSGGFGLNESIVLACKDAAVTCGLPD